MSHRNSLFACAGARELHEPRIHHGEPHGEQPGAACNGPLLAARALVRGVPIGAGGGAPRGRCLRVRVLQQLRHDGVLRQDRHVNPVVRKAARGGPGASASPGARSTDRRFCQVVGFLGRLFEICGLGVQCWDVCWDVMLGCNAGM
eukprot:5195131-Pyramimonas_sp.AAC.1